MQRPGPSVRLVLLGLPLSVPAGKWLAGRRSLSGKETLSAAGAATQKCTQRRSSRSNQARLAPSRTANQVGLGKDIFVQLSSSTRIHMPVGCGLGPRLGPLELDLAASSLAVEAVNRFGHAWRAVWVLLQMATSVLTMSPSRRRRVVWSSGCHGGQTESEFETSSIEEGG